MADNCAVTILDNIDDMSGRLTDGGILIINTLVLRILYQGIPPDGDDDQFGHGTHPFETSLFTFAKIYSRTKLSTYMAGMTAYMAAA